MPTTITHGVGTAETSELVWAPHRDELVTYDNRYSAGMMSAHRFDYTRDATSRITQETQSLLDGQSVFSRTFSYNTRSELTSDAGSGLSYDAQGNRTTGYGTAYQANALNQYSTVAGVAWTYDADGNPLSDGVRTFVYDAENRLVQAGSHSFSYDYRHRLVKAVGPSWPLGPSGTSWRLYDGNKVVLREDSVGGYTLRGEYVWGRDLAGRHASGDGTGGLLAVISNGITYVPHYDGRGNIWRFSGGSLRSMNAFGDVAFANYYPPALIETTLLSLAHGSKEFFYSLGLYNYGRRFYDPRNGRFVGRDPIEEKGGLNLHQFVRNDPLNRWDQLGLVPNRDPYPPGAVWRNMGPFAGGNAILWEAFYGDEPAGDSFIESLGHSFGNDGSPDCPACFFEDDSTAPKIPCSQLRKQLLGSVLPESHGATGYLSGVGSYLSGNYKGFSQAWRFMPNAYNSNMVSIWGFADRNVYKAHQLYQELGVRLFFDDEYRGHAAQIFMVYASQNWEKLTARAVSGISVSYAIHRFQGPMWMGSIFAANAIKGDVLDLIEKGVDPLLALTAGVIGYSDDIIEGEVNLGGKDGLKRLEQMLWDDKFIQTISRTPCEEGK